MSLRLLASIALFAPGAAIAQARCDVHAGDEAYEKCLRAGVDTAQARLFRTAGLAMETLPESARPAFVATNDHSLDSARAVCRARSGEMGGTARNHFLQCLTTFAQNRERVLIGRYHLQGPIPASVACVGYEPDSVSLSGILEQRTFPGLPNYSSVAAGDEPETGFYLRLLTPLCVSRSIDIWNRPAAGVQLLQLWVVKAAINDSLGVRVGQPVTVRGTLSYAFTAHHHTQVLLSVHHF